MKGIVLAVVALLFIAVVGYVGWQFKRQWNYSWAYESMVEQTAEKKVCEMVKPEYLKDPEKC